MPRGQGVLPMHRLWPIVQNVDFQDQQRESETDPGLV